MAKKLTSKRVTLFYSYSHKDIVYKKGMETALALLRRDGFLMDWSDAQILPGQSISSTVRTKQSESQISVFLLSPDFLDSDECLREWQHAKQLAESGTLLFRVPIIIRECAWLDFLEDDDLKALPSDGTPVSSYDDPDTAWQQVYEGISAVVDELRNTHSARPTFLDELDAIELPSLKPVALSDLFVFPNLVEYKYGKTVLHESVISSFDQLRGRDRTIIYGQEKSGKTALARQLVFSHIQDGDPVLFLDMGTATCGPKHDWLRRTYEDQFHGDYNLWYKQDHKALVIDNMHEERSILDFVVACKDDFTQIYLITLSDIFYSYLRDERQLAEFHPMSLEPLTHNQQEKLIRRGLETIEPQDPVTDSLVDHAEDRVNSIIISNRIVPRYPFFVLSILQTYDALMPQSLSITSYGHCYYVLILASLHRAGISTSDESVNSCFNFAEQLALATFRCTKESRGSVDFAEFCKIYDQQYFMQDSVLNRLTHKEYGIITEDGQFKTDYMYYFFLGKLLANDTQLAEEFLPDLCEKSYIGRNYLILMFAIHHARDDEIIQDIVLGAMVELDEIAVATLNKGETARFATIVSELPETVLSTDSVEEERLKEREARDTLESVEGGESDEDELDEDDRFEIGMLRIFRNTRILGQVLRNQSGKLPKRQIEEIVETVADSSFRLVNAVLSDEDEIAGLAQNLASRFPAADHGEIQRLLRWSSFLWTMVNIEQAVHAVGVPSIRDAVDAVVARNPTPAYQILGYFCLLDGANGLSPYERDVLSRLYKEHSDVFVRWVLSMRTQMYMNTHSSDVRIEQSICSVLRIPYTFRLKSSETTIIS